MLMRKPPFEDDRMLGQDSFSAPVEGGWRPAQNAHFASAWRDGRAACHGFCR